MDTAAEAAGIRGQPIKPVEPYYVFDPPPSGGDEQARSAWERQMVERLLRYLADLRATVDGRDVSVDGAKLDTYSWQEPVISAAVLAPPGGESPGDRYLIAGVGTGAWTGKDDQIAEYNGSGWDYTAPTNGMGLLNLAALGLPLFHLSGAWTADLTIAGDLTILDPAKNIVLGGLVDGRDVSVDGAKLDGIEAAADVTDAANVAAAGATMDTDASLAGNSYFLDEDTMSSDSATKVASQQSIKAYVDGQFSTTRLMNEGNLSPTPWYGGVIGYDSSYPTKRLMGDGTDDDIGHVVVQMGDGDANFDGSTFIRIELVSELNPIPAGATNGYFQVVIRSIEIDTADAGLSSWLTVAIPTTGATDSRVITLDIPDTDWDMADYAAGDGWDIWVRRISSNAADTYEAESPGDIYVRSVRIYCGRS